MGEYVVNGVVDVKSIKLDFGYWVFWNWGWVYLGLWIGF